MQRSINTVTLLVHDYDEAIDYYTVKLNFNLVEDIIDTKSDNRRVLVAPSADTGVRLILAKASNDAQSCLVGNQAGGRVFLYLNTDDFWCDHTLMSAQGVIFNETPREEPYGTVAIFQDLYGNLWDLIQPCSYTE